MSVERRDITTGPRRPRRRRVTASLAALLAALALLAGVVIGYVARGGPADPVLVTTEQEIPAVTVTVETPD